VCDDIYEYEVTFLRAVDEPDAFVDVRFPVVAVRLDWMGFESRVGGVTR
jgi:hypothetical protein